LRERYWDGRQWGEQLRGRVAPMPWWLVAGLSLVFMFAVLVLFF
jgi:hypothetical protein